VGGGGLGLITGSKRQQWAKINAPINVILWRLGWGEECRQRMEKRFGPILEAGRINSSNLDRNPQP